MLPFERLLTNGALKWSRVAVNFLVRFEITKLCEGIETHCAFVRSDTSVHHLVCLEIPKLGK